FPRRCCPLDQAMLPDAILRHLTARTRRDDLSVPHFQASLPEEVSGSQRGMTAMPVRRALVGVSGPEQCLLPEVRRHELERNRRASVGETAWQCNRWAAACIERAGVAEEGR